MDDLDAFHQHTASVHVWSSATSTSFAASGPRHQRAHHGNVQADGVEDYIRAGRNACRFVRNDPLGRKLAGKEINRLKP